MLNKPHVKNKPVIIKILIASFCIGLSAHNSFAQLDANSFSEKSITDLYDENSPYIAWVTHNKQSPTKTSSLFPIMDSIYYWGWDTTINGWSSSPKWKDLSFTYDTHYNLLGYLSQGWNGSNWDNYSMITNSYDANDNQTNSLYQLWSGTAWEDRIKYIYTFDVNNNLTNQIRQFALSGFPLMNQEQFIYTYDASNNQTSILHQNFNGTAWVNGYQNIFQYDTNNNQTYSIYQQWYNNAWQNQVLDSSFYDVNNNLMQVIHSIWNTNAWVNSSKNLYTYDVSLILVKKCFA